MQFCEQCNGTEQLLRKKQQDILLEHGIEISEFSSASPRQRLGLIRNHFNLDRQVNIETRPVPKEFGLIVVKPEMFDQSEKIESFLVNKLGVKVLTSQPFVYSPEAYWAIYGRNFIDYFGLFPHGALLFLLSISLPSRAVVFQHFSPQKYCELKRSMVTSQDHDIIPEIVHDSEDPQDFFDKLFVRSNHSSIRSELCRPDLDDRGFGLMANDSCPGKCWDFTETFANRTPQQNQRTFNGVHCPGNQKDLRVAFAAIPIKI